MSCRYSATSAISILVLALGACSTESDDQREAAITHALANPDLQRSAAEFTGLGWVVSDRAAASVDWPDAGTSSQSRSQSRSDAAQAIWTRVRVPMVRPDQPGEPGARVDLVVAWPEVGVDEFVVMPHGEAAGAELTRALEASDGPAAQGLPSLAAPETTLAACGRESAACGGTTTCCAGLACREVSDNHFSCTCSDPRTIVWNDGATASTACIGPHNPFGAARWVGIIQGCGAGGGLFLDFCGKLIGSPKYVRSSRRLLACYDVPPSACRSE
jgi:hypothetical protein